MVFVLSLFPLNLQQFKGTFLIHYKYGNLHLIKLNVCILNSKFKGSFKMGTYPLKRVNHPHNTHLQIFPLKFQNTRKFFFLFLFFVYSFMIQTL